MSGMIHSCLYQRGAVPWRGGSIGVMGGCSVSFSTLEWKNGLENGEMNMNFSVRGT